MLDGVREIAKRFISENYSDEARFFEAMWTVLCPRLRDWKRLPAEAWPLPDTSRMAATEVGLTGPEAVDLVTPIVVATMGFLMREAYEKDLSLEELEALTGKTAAHFGANPGLTAQLVKHAPGLCEAVTSAKPGAKKAVVSGIESPQYKIWSRGKCVIVDDISGYERKKRDYLFWIDMDEKKHMSVRIPGVELKRMAARLLFYLVQRLGKRVPVTDVLREVFEDEIPEPGGTEKNRIDQQLSALEKFCGGGFREHVFEEWFEKGLGLKRSFLEGYFIYRSLR
ncbi:MAG: hypothetical protein JXC85_04465 [Candidatus Aenigmarchaeota archaeon]|nr:hypothetical protein [Candidatus Aenigmarchaeota archaeon]